MPAKGQKRKQQIIDTAKEMFIQNGFQSTHIGQVCEKLNIARGPFTSISETSAKYSTRYSNRSRRT